MMAESRTDRRLRYFRSGVNADFTITCNGREWKLHKAILSVESTFFEAMCYGRFEEATSGKADFPDQEPEVLDQVLLYLYTGIYDDLVVLKEEADTDEDTKKTAAFDEDGKKAAKTDDDPEGEQLSAQDEADESKQDSILSAYVSWICAQDWPEVQRLEDATQSGVTKVFTTAIMTYQCAKMMGLGDLQSLVVAKLMDKEEYLGQSDLSAVLETLFNQTEANDLEMRIKLVSRCVENCQGIAEVFPKAAELLDYHERAAWNIGRQLLTERDDKNTQLQDSRALVTEKRAQLEQANEKVAQGTKREKQLRKDLANADRESNLAALPCQCGQHVLAPGNVTYTVSSGGSGGRYWNCSCGLIYTPRSS